MLSSNLGQSANYSCLCPAELSSSEVIDEMRQKLDGMGKQSVKLKLVVDMVAADCPRYKYTMLPVT